jgi:hypothetical protein
MILAQPWQQAIFSAGLSACSIDAVAMPQQRY